MLYLRQSLSRLALKLFRGEPAISGFDWNFSPIHTSSPPFSRVRLEFLPYPHLITTLFNGCVFGPPLPFTATSAWTWIDHPVSGLPVPTNFALLRLGFPSAPHLLCLTLPAPATRRTVLQKVRGSTYHSCSTACKHRVSGSLSLPSRGSFHLSFTVLDASGH